MERGRRGGVERGRREGGEEGWRKGIGGGMVRRERRDVWKEGCVEGGKGGQHL